MERTTAFRVPYKRGRRKNEPHLLVSSRGPSPRSGPWSQLRQQSGKGVSKLRPEKQERPASSLCWPRKNLLRKSILGATLADRLQAGDAQFTEFFVFWEMPCCSCGKMRWKRLGPLSTPSSRMPERCIITSQARGDLVSRTVWLSMWAAGMTPKNGRRVQPLL